MNREEALELANRALAEGALKFSCGFCGRECMVPTSRSDGLAFITHMSPTCERFDTLDPGDFLAASRRAQGIYMPWDSLE